MENISLILYTKGFFGLVLKSPTQMGSLSINNSVTNISRLGTFKVAMKNVRLLFGDNPPEQYTCRVKLDIGNRTGLKPKSIEMTYTGPSFLAVI
jgi:hypothetical protein